MPATAPIEQYFIYHEYYIRGHVDVECIFPLEEQKLVMANYESLFLAEKIALPVASYLYSMQIFGSLEQDKSVTVSDTTPQTHGSAIGDHKNA